MFYKAAIHSKVRRCGCFGSQAVSFLGLSWSINCPEVVFLFGPCG